MTTTDKQREKIAEVIKDGLLIGSEYEIAGTGPRYYVSNALEVADAILAALTPSEPPEWVSEIDGLFEAAINEIGPSYFPLKFDHGGGEAVSQDDAAAFGGFDYDNLTDLAVKLRHYGANSPYMMRYITL